ncbi:MauE/DoxX family redox-associated membrane protein [Streptomyces virginiae]|uniref:MauE/DoxX family redox-associated membrane protein n=1 Tax=Streptomyces virginiae TaxID=1961 RepID=UPI00332639F5
MLMLGEGVTVMSVVVGLRVAVGVVFFLAAASKSSRRGRADFRIAVGAFVPGAGGRWAGVLVVVTVAAEWAVVVLLAVPVRGASVAGFGLAGAALAVFTVVLVWGLRRGVSAPCRCFGSSARPVSGVQVVRNVLLLTLAVLGLYVCVTAGGGRVPVAGLWVSAGAGALLGAVLSVFDDLAGLFITASPPRRLMTGREAVTRREFPR